MTGMLGNLSPLSPEFGSEELGRVGGGVDSTSRTVAPPNECPARQISLSTLIFGLEPFFNQLDQKHLSSR